MRMRDQPSAVRRQLSGQRYEGSCLPRRKTRFCVQLLALVSCFCLLCCSRRPDPDTLVMIIESSPTNLDPRMGIDGQSERIDGLLFENLVSRDEHLSVKPELAER